MTELHRRSPLSTGCASVLLYVGCFTILHAQSPCDPDLPRIAGNEHFVYQERDSATRCEGLYARLQGARAELALVSLTRSFPNIDPRGSSPLELAWSAPGPGQVRLRGYGLRYKLFFRMDAAPPGVASRFVWPNAMLKELDIRRPELGTVAWLPYVVAGSNRVVYLPLRIGAQSPPGSAGGNLEAVIMTTAVLDEVRLTLDFLSEKRAPPSRLVDNQPLQLTSYPAERPIHVPLTSVAGRGFYHATITGTLADGGSSGTDFWFFCDGT